MSKEEFGFNPDQDRDERGRWASGGGDGAVTERHGDKAAARTRRKEIEKELIDDGYMKIAGNADDHGDSGGEDQYVKVSEKGTKVARVGQKGGDVKVETSTHASPPGGSKEDRFKDVLRNDMQKVRERAMAERKKVAERGGRKVLSSDDEPETFSNRIIGAEVFDTGTWNGLKFTDEDLDSIAAAFTGLGLQGRVPLKFGHAGKDSRVDDSQPALGWVQKVYRKGSKLVADISDIPTEVYSAIRKGLYKFVSVELLRNVPAGTRKIPWVLDAVALLGATPPAVGTLKDLQALTYARDTGLQYEGVAEFTRANFKPQLSEERHSMSDGNQALLERIQELTLQNAALQDENRGLKDVKAKFAQLETRFNSLVEDVEKKRVSDHRTKIKDRLEAAVRAEQILPAARERFAKAYRVEDDEAVTAIEIADVEEFIRENPHPNPKKDKRARATFSLNDPTGDVPHGTPADEESKLRVFASLAKKGIHEPTAEQITAETMALFRANPELGTAWKFQTDEFYSKR